MNESHFYHLGKQEYDTLAVQDPNNVQYGRSVWLSSLRSNEEVPKWPYKKGRWEGLV